MSNNKYSDRFVVRSALSDEELQAKLSRKAHKFADKKKKADKYACRGPIHY